MKKVVNYTNDEKIRIGKSLEYIRRCNQVTFKTIKEAHISSITVFYKMKNGQIVLNDNFYDAYLKYFDKQYIRKDNYEIWFNNYLSRFKQVLEYYDYDQINKLYQELQDELSSYQNSIYYKQIFDAFTWIYDYYKFEKYMTLENINNALVMIESSILEKEIIIFLLEVMYISNNNVHYKVDIREKIYKYTIDYDDPILLYIKAFYQKVNANFNQAEKLFNKSYQFWHNKKIYLREIKSATGCFLIYQNTDVGLANEFSEKILKYKELDIPNLLKVNINYNVAMYLYLSKSYKKAYDLFVENIEKYKSYRELIFVCSCCTHLNLDYPNELFNKEAYLLPTNIYLEYFRINKDDCDKKVFYILDQIMDKELIHYQWKWPFWGMFEYELFKIVKVKKKYFKYYSMYKEKMEKHCKDA